MNRFFISSLVVVLLQLCVLPTFGQKQGQKLIDSLCKEVPKFKDDTSKVNLLIRIAALNRFSNIDTSLKYAQYALNTAQKIKFQSGISDAYNNIGIAYSNMANYPKALEFFQKSLNANYPLKDERVKAIVYINIGLIHTRLQDYKLALEYQQKALKIFETYNNTINISKVLSNIGALYDLLNEKQLALESFKKALVISEVLGNKNAIATSLSNIGLTYFKISEYAKALEYYNKAESMLHQTSNLESLAVLHSNKADLYYNMPDSEMQKIGLKPSERYVMAKRYMDSALVLNTKIGNMYGQKDNQEFLSELYAKKNDYVNAYHAYKEFIALRDSTESEDIKSEITQKEMQFEFERKEVEYLFQQRLTQEKLLRSTKEALLIKKEKEIQHLAFLKEQSERQEKEQQLNLSEKERQLQATKVNALKKEKESQEKELAWSQEVIIQKNRQKNYSIAGGILMLALAFFMYKNYSNQRNLNTAISQEKKKTDELLLNILPAEVAEELKVKGNVTAKQYGEVSILFTDFVNFTQTSERLTPQQLVEELNEYFTAFDKIMDKYGLEKIKTVGDAYLAVCGLPVANKNHAQNTVKAAIEINKFVQKRNETGRKFKIRIGINSGSVVAGIIGVNKFAYDIWGDSVNIAARMEQSGDAGKINISETTYQLIKNNFSCTYRGEVNAKNKGMMNMYFVNDSLDEKIS